MSHRDNNVWLAPEEARCEPTPSPQCGRWSCGRYRAPVPAIGGIVADFNHNRTSYSSTCPQWISAEMKPPASTTLEKRPVFKSLGG